MQRQRYKTRKIKNDMRIEKMMKAQEAKNKERQAAHEQRNARMNSPDFLIPKPIKNKHEKKIYENVVMKSGLIPSHPESVNFVGPSGSGKSVNLIYMYRNFYENYWHETYLFAFTGKSDDGFKNLDIPKNNIYTEDLEDNLNTIIDKQKKEVESVGFNKSKRLLIVLEDVSSSPKLIRSKVFTRLYTEVRHLNISVWSCSHKYKILSPVARANCMNLILYPLPSTELDSVSDDWCPPNLHKKEFMGLIRDAHTKDERLVRPFLYIKAKEPFKTRFRRGFEDTLELK